MSEFSDVSEVTKEGIYHITEFVHVANGKIICFMPGVMDVNDKSDMKTLLELGEVLYDGDGTRRSYGNNTVCILYGRKDKWFFNIVHADNMLEHKDIIKKLVKQLYG